MVELLPCSKCRRVPGHDHFQVHSLAAPMYSFRCWQCGRRVRGMGTEQAAADQWNRTYGAPLTLAEKPQDVPALDDEPSVGDGVTLLHDRVRETWVGKARAAKAVRVGRVHSPTSDMPRFASVFSQEEASRKNMPAVRCDGQPLHAWRSCVDARWRGGVCSHPAGWHEPSWIEERG